VGTASKAVLSTRDYTFPGLIRDGRGVRFSSVAIRACRSCKLALGLADILLMPTAATIPNGVNNVGGATLYLPLHHAARDLRTTTEPTSKMTGRRTKADRQLGVALGGIRAGWGSRRQTGCLVPGASNGAERCTKSVPSRGTASVASSPRFWRKTVSVSGMSQASLPRRSITGRRGSDWHNQIAPRLVARAAYGVFFGVSKIWAAARPGFQLSVCSEFGIFQADDVSPFSIPTGNKPRLRTG